MKHETTNEQRPCGLCGGPVAYINGMWICGQRCATAGAERGPTMTPEEEEHLANRAIEHGMRLAEQRIIGIIKMAGAISSVAAVNAFAENVIAAIKEGSDHA